MSHTPAPWTIRSAPTEYGWIIDGAGDYQGIADVAFTADARVIATAPDLLAACKYLTAEIRNGATSRDEALRRGVAMAEAIIRKADGEV